MEATESPGFFKRLLMNPLAVRELRVACRSWKLVIILSAYLLIQGAIFAIWLYVQSEGGIYDDPTSIGRGLFITMSVVLVIVVMLVFPAFSSTAIASEHEKKSFDLLLLTPLSPWEIALGKFFAAGMQSSIFIIATIPLFAMANLFGGIEPEAFFMVLWVLILFSVFISFVGVYASSLVKKAIPAVLVTYLFAFAIGFVLLLFFILLSVAMPLLAGLVPALMHMFDPTFGEGIYYVITLTTTCAIYCSFLFLSTTNRLKPTSHNKSTGLRLLWTAAAIVIPVQIGAYFLVVRIAGHSGAYGALLLGGVYFALVMLVPTVSASAEPPMPSRRVRREMDKYPEGLMKGGGQIFFPGGARGTLHTAIIATLGMVLMVVVGWIYMSQMSGELDDKANLVAEYSSLMSASETDLFSDPAAAARARMAVMGTPESEMREAVSTFLSHEFEGFLVLLGTLLITLLATAQITWRMTLSGLSKTLAGVLAGLILAVWLVVPFIVQMIGNANVETENAVYAQFSPIQAGINGVEWGKENGRAEIMQGIVVQRHENRADALEIRWMTFMGTGVAIAAALLALNVVSHRKVMERIRKLTGEDGEQLPQPVETTQAQVEQAIAAVTAPEAHQQGPPGAPPPPPGPMPPTPADQQGGGFDDIAQAAAEQAGAGQAPPDAPPSEPPPDFEEKPE